MSRYSEKINTLDKLEKKIAHLKGRSKKLEQQLEQNFDYLQDNYGSMVKSSILRKTSSAAENFTAFLMQSLVNQHPSRKLLKQLLSVLRPRHHPGLKR